MPIGNNNQGRGQRQGRMGGRGLGPEGNCVCPSCGATAAHKRGIPCTDVSCPKCGTKMTRGR